MHLFKFICLIPKLAVSEVPVRVLLSRLRKNVSMFVNLLTTSGTRVFHFQQLKGNYFIIVICPTTISTMGVFFYQKYVIKIIVGNSNGRKQKHSRLRSILYQSLQKIGVLNVKYNYNSITYVIFRFTGMINFWEKMVWIIFGLLCVEIQINT